jgi:hypothetical protein
MIRLILGFIFVLLFVSCDGNVLNKKIGKKEIQSKIGADKGGTSVGVGNPPSGDDGTSNNSPSTSVNPGGKYLMSEFTQGQNNLSLSFAAYSLSPLAVQIRKRATVNSDYEDYLFIGGNGELFSYVTIDRDDFLDIAEFRDLKKMTIGLEFSSPTTQQFTLMLQVWASGNDNPSQRKHAYELSFEVQKSVKSLSMDLSKSPDFKSLTEFLDVNGDLNINIYSKNAYGKVILIDKEQLIFKAFHSR